MARDGIAEIYIGELSFVAVAYIAMVLRLPVIKWTMGPICSTIRNVANRPIHR